jgi:hypothetical protein
MWCLISDKTLTVTDSQRYENTLSNKTHEWNPKINQTTSSECHAPTAQRKLQPSAVRPADHSIFPSAQSRLPHSSAERRAPSAERPFFQSKQISGGVFQLGKIKLWVGVGESVIKKDIHFHSILDSWANTHRKDYRSPQTQSYQRCEKQFKSANVCWKWISFLITDSPTPTHNLILPSWNTPPEICLLWKNGRSALGARRSALEWGSLLWALGKIEWSAGRTALGWSFLWAVGAWHSEEVVWLILGFHSCVLLLRVFSYRWESVTVKVLSLIRHHISMFFFRFSRGSLLAQFFSALGARVFCFWVHYN